MNSVRDPGVSFTFGFFSTRRKLNVIVTKCYNLCLRGPIQKFMFLIFGI